MKVTKQDDFVCTEKKLQMEKASKKLLTTVDTSIIAHNKSKN